MTETHGRQGAGLRRFVALVRSLPIRRGKMRLLGPMLAARREVLRDHEFVCPRGYGVRWSGRGLPDLLTQHMLLDGFYQREVMSALRHLVKPGQVVFDVGAHHGLMSVVAARSVGPTGRVVAFEPNPFIQELLRHHLAINGASQVKIEACGVSDAEGKLPFYARSDAYAWNSSFTREFADPGGTVQPVLVPVTTLDQYVARTRTQPNLIKIDTEGTEMKVLQGARQTLTEARPKVVMELNPSSASAVGLKVADYVAFFRALNYGIFVLPRSATAVQYRLRRRFEEAVDCPGGSLTNVVCMADNDPDHDAIVPPTV